MDFTFARIWYRNQVRKGTKNVAADHLSRIENDESSDDSEVDDNFSGETLMEINTKDKPWFADFANYLVGDFIPKGMTYQQKNNFFSDLKHYYWEEPYLFKPLNPSAATIIEDKDRKYLTPFWIFGTRDIVEPESPLPPSKKSLIIYFLGWMV
uniref:Reverse transcriptase domain-containing protein n=1 Tax=Tanacetum cinerariifolium TaxID=118510 RepID=A0A699K4Y9_TANCI|nr:reverse transcriptase domain-containing protein [Tanacetum cinerariifolium]